MFIYGFMKKILSVVLFMLSDNRYLFAWSCNLCKMINYTWKFWENFQLEAVLILWTQVIKKYSTQFSSDCTCMIKEICFPDEGGAASHFNFHEFHLKFLWIACDKNERLILIGNFHSASFEVEKVFARD